MNDDETIVFVDTPLGVVAASMYGNEIRALRFDSAHGRRRADTDRQLAAALGRWFECGCEPTEFRLAPRGTTFQQQVWALARRIPRGTVCSYSTLAMRLGRPRAARAVASALAANPILLLIPCHRVVGADGQLRGYAAGVDRKRALLAIEHASGCAASSP